MNFINPFLLLFAAAASVPLLLHLFNKQRIKVVEFSTIKYLLSLQKTRMRKLKIRQILLLILRTLILLAVAFAFARPTVEGDYLQALGGKTTTTAVLMIDISASSATETNQGSYFENSIEKAHSILESFTDKDKVVLLGFGSEIIYNSGKSSSDFERLNQQLDEMTPSYSEASPTTAFTHAYQLLSTTSDPNLEIYLISDLQGESWRKFDFDLFALDQLPVKLFLYTTAQDDVDNSSLENIKFPNQIITAGRNFNLQVDVSNHKAETPAELLVTMQLNEQKVAQNNLSLPPSGKGTIKFEQTAGATGFLYGAIEIDDDDLLADNKYYYGLRIPSLAKVLLVSDNQQEAFLIEKALAPFTEQNYFKEIRTLNLTQAASTNLFNYDVVIVNLTQLPTHLVSSLRTYLNAGGSTLFLMPAKQDLKNFSAKIAKPIFGLQLVSAPSEPDKSKGGYLLNNLNLDHPIFSPYRKFETAEIPQVEFYSHFETLESAQATTLARFSDNTPAVLEGRSGSGRAILCTFNFDEKYSAITTHPLMVILLNRTIEYLASEPLNQREMLISGTEITRVLTAQSARQFSLVDPLGDTTQFSPTIQEGEIIFNLGFLDRPGIYRLIGDNKIVDLFALNFPNNESELSYLTGEEIGDKIKDVKLIILNSEIATAELIAQARFGRELWKVLILLGFLLMLVEMVIAASGKKPESQEA